MRPLLFGLCCVVLLTACRGPKGSPDSTVKSFFSAAVAQDYEAMATILTRDSLGKLGSKESAAGYFASQFKGWADVDLDIGEWNIDVGGKTATVRFSCVGETLVNYKVMKFDCSDAFSLVLEEDDKWHLVLPAAQKLRPK